MKVGFITAFGVGYGHIARCLALRAGLEERGHEIVGADDGDWLIIDDPTIEPHCSDCGIGVSKLRLAVRDDDSHKSYYDKWCNCVIQPHLQPHLAWVGRTPPAKMVCMGMSPRGIAIENALEYFDFGSEFGQSEWVLGAPGHSSWERCAARVPTMQVIFAEAQLLVAKACEEAGAAVTVWNELEEGKLVPERLRTRVLAAYDEYDASTVAKNAYALCDGRGVERTIKLMEEVI